MIVKPCSVPEIRNCIDIIKSVTIWVKYFPKRDALLVVIIGQSAYSSCRQTLLNICITRWAENIDGWEHFSMAHSIGEDVRSGTLWKYDFPLYSDGWSSEDKQNTLAYMKKQESFEFVSSMVTLFRSLLYLKEAVGNLHGIRT